MVRRALAMVAAMGVVGIGASVFGCLNDTRTEQAEREFRSRYAGAEPQRADERFVVGGVNVLGVAVAGMGAMLAVTGLRRCLCVVLGKGAA